MDVREDAGLSDDYKLKLNSYDLGVDIELADAIQRLRFEHPEVRAVIVASLKERIFCAGANIMMLRGSSHCAKVNFCKFTNETRLAIEDASAHSGLKFLAALNGVCAGGGYELALACDEIILVDDGNSAVSLPEAPLLGVLPGTGGLTRVVDKRRVRRDLADYFSTLVEGVKGKRAVEWRLVDAVSPTSQFKDAVQKRAHALAATSDRPATRPRHRAERPQPDGHRLVADVFGGDAVVQPRQAHGRPHRAGADRPSAVDAGGDSQGRRSVLGPARVPRARRRAAPAARQRAGNRHGRHPDRRRSRRRARDRPDARPRISRTGSSARSSTS